MNVSRLPSKRSDYLVFNEWIIWHTKIFFCGDAFKAFFFFCISVDNGGPHLDKEFNLRIVAFTFLPSLGHLSPLHAQFFRSCRHTLFFFFFFKASPAKKKNPQRFDEPLYSQGDVAPATGWCFIPLHLWRFKATFHLFPLFVVGALLVFGWWQTTPDDPRLLPAIPVRPVNLVPSSRLCSIFRKINLIRRLTLCSLLSFLWWLLLLLLLFTPPSNKIQSAPIRGCVLCWQISVTRKDKISVENARLILTHLTHLPTAGLRSGIAGSVTQQEAWFHYIQMDLFFFHALSPSPTFHHPPAEVAIQFANVSSMAFSISVFVFHRAKDGAPIPKGMREAALVAKNDFDCVHAHNGAKRPPFFNCAKLRASVKGPKNWVWPAPAQVSASPRARIA